MSVAKRSRIRGFVPGPGPPLTKLPRFAWWSGMIIQLLLVVSADDVGYDDGDDDWLDDDVDG